MNEKDSITKSAGIISGATFLSRILGFLRDVMIAAFFGTGLYAQAFVVAFRIPNILRSVIGEGATNAVMVPVLSGYISKESREEFWELAGNLINLIFLFLIGITITGVLIAPVIVRIIAPGFINQPEKLLLTVKLTKLMFPYVFFIGLTSIFIGILNSFKYFTIPSLSQAVFNFLFISFSIIFYFLLDWGVYSLAVAVLIGGVGQTLIHIPSLYKYGFRKTGQFYFIHPTIKKMGRLFLPRLLGAGVYHINILVDTMLASLTFIVGKGGVAALYYSNRLVQFPLAIFGIALAQAVLPTFSRQSLEEGLSKFKKTLNFSLRGIFFVTVPSAIGLIVLRQPIIEILFKRGEFGDYSTTITSYTLFFYAFGLFAFAGIKILVSSFYSLKDAITPVKIAAFSVFINIILNLILMRPLKIGGIALATSISATLDFLLLFYFLRKRIGSIYEKRIVVTLSKALISAGIMGIMCYMFYFKFFAEITKVSFLIKTMSLLLTIIIGIISYIIISNLLNMSEAKKSISFIKEKLF